LEHYQIVKFLYQVKQKLNKFVDDFYLGDLSERVILGAHFNGLCPDYLLKNKPFFPLADTFWGSKINKPQSE